MGLGYALTERYPIVDGRPQVKYAILGLFRANEAPPIETVLVDSGFPIHRPTVPKVSGVEHHPDRPAVQNAYWRFDGKFRTSLPLKHRLPSMAVITRG